MGIIVKSGEKNNKPGGTGLAGFNLVDIAASGRKQLDRARQEAERIVEQAQQQANATLQKAKKEGEQAGLAEGRAKADEELEKKVAEELRKRSELLDKMVSELARKETLWLQQFSETITTSAFEIAKLVIRRSLATEREIVLDWLEEALQNTRSAKQLTVTFHPKTLVELGENIEKILNQIGLPESSRVEPDEHVERHGFIIRQEGGAIDAQLTTQLERLAQMLDL